MTEFQRDNGGRGVYSFELPDEEWRFLGENWTGTERMNYKPVGMPDINDRISSWGAAELNAIQSGAGYRAFEGGPWPGNVSSLLGAGGAFRCFWDETGDAMWHCAGSTGSDDGKQNLMKYDAARDVFVHWTTGRNVAASFVVDDTYFTPTATEFEAVVTCSDPSWQTDGYFVDYLVDWLPGSVVQDYEDADVEPKNPAQPNRHINSVTMTPQGRAHFTMAYAYDVVPASGDTGEIDDSAASLWPRKGSAHNFGTSAWDQARRRLYKIMRTAPTGDNIFWPHWVNVAGEAAYGSRAEWIAGRSTWLDRAAEGEGKVFTNSWPQCVYASHIGATGSLIVLQVENRTLDRFDCSTRAWTSYAQLPDMQMPLSGNWSGGTLGRRGVTMVLVGQDLYLGGFTDGVNEFWKITLPADGGAYTLDRNLAPCPVPMDLSGYGWPGTHTELCVLGDRIYAFHTDLWGTDGERAYTGGVYRYDPATNSWSGILNGSESWAQKLIALGRLDPVSGSSPHNFTVTEIPRLGCFLMAANITSFSFGAWLFKPPTA
jgi:hypothetical protein